jgi:PAS domain S-box-containing protein
MPTRSVHPLLQSKPDNFILSLIANKTINSALVTDTAGLITWVNKQFENITGYSLKEVIGKKPGDFLQGKESDPAVISHMRERIKNREGFLVEIINYTKSGTPYWVEIDVEPITDNEGVFAGFFSIQKDITKLKETTLVLSQYVENLEAIYDLLPNTAIYQTYRKDGDEELYPTYTFMSAGMEEISELSREEMMANPARLFSLLDEESLKRMAKAQVTAIKQYSMLDEEVEFTTPSGLHKFVRIMSRPMKIKGGMRFYGVIFNLTEKKLLEQKVAMYNEQANIINTNIPGGAVFQLLVTKDGKRQFKYYSKGIETMTGYRVEDILRDPEVLLAKTPLEDRQKISALEQASILEMKAFEVECRTTTADGRLIWRNIKSRPRQVSEGIIFEGFSSDITEKKLLMLSLTESEIRFERMIETLDVGIIVQGKDNQVNHINKKAIELFQTERSSLLGKATLGPEWKTIGLDGIEISPDDRPTARAIREKQNVQMPLGIKGPGFEDWKWIYVNSTVVKNDQGDVHKLTTSLTDVTELRKYKIELEVKNKQLTDSLKEKELLLKEMHHRVKNSLQSISSIIYLKSLTLKDPYAIGLMQDMRDRLIAISLIHERLLDSDQVDLINIGEYIRKLVNELRRTVKDNHKGIAIEVHAEDTELSSEIASCCGILINEIVTNSIKHGFKTGGEGRIDVIFKRIGPKVFILKVIDNGLGISDKALHNKPRATLGLQLIDVFVSQLNGTLKVWSEQGTTSEIQFEIADKKHNI